MSVTNAIVDRFLAERAARATHGGMAKQQSGEDNLKEEGGGKGAGAGEPESDEKKLEKLKLHVADVEAGLLRAVGEIESYAKRIGRANTYQQRTLSPEEVLQKALGHEELHEKQLEELKESIRGLHLGNDKLKYEQLKLEIQVVNIEVRHVQYVLERYAPGKYPNITATPEEQTALEKQFYKRLKEHLKRYASGTYPHTTPTPEEQTDLEEQFKKRLKEQLEELKKRIRGLHPEDKERKFKVQSLEDKELKWRVQSLELMVVETELGHVKWVVQRYASRTYPHTTPTRKEQTALENEQTALEKQFKNLDESVTKLRDQL